MDSRTILVTGFEPFGGEKVNPSWEAVRRLDDSIGPFSISKVLLPVTFGEAESTLIQALRRLEPAVTVCVGQAGGARGIRAERVAVNLRDASIPDNAGLKPCDEAVIPGGPAAYFSTLPVRDIVGALRAHGIPADISMSAGTFVCNSVMYALMHHLQGSDMIGGFIHVPFLSEQAAARPGQTGMEPDLMAKALAISIEVSIRYLKGCLSEPGV